jgi:hypothetical protein
MKKFLLDYNLKVRIPIIIFVAVSVFTATYYLSYAERNGVGYQPDQPIAYSHKKHAGDLGIDCRYCHSDVEKSRHANIPSADACMNCHSVVKTDSPEIQKLKKYFDEGKPIPWKRIHKVPDFVYFNHSVHVNKGIDCSNCHGNIASMEKVEQVNAFTMAACLECHRDPHLHVKNFNKDFLTGQTLVKDEKIVLPDNSKAPDNKSKTDRMKGSAGMNKDSLGTGPDNCSACHR